jgi:hypothetical protein
LRGAKVKIIAFNSIKTSPQALQSQVEQKLFKQDRGIRPLSSECGCITGRQDFNGNLAVESNRSLF